MATQPALFRQEAIDFLHQRHSWGEFVSLQPISSTILSWSLASLVAFILCFLSIAQYARKETVTGYLTPTFGTAKIFVPQQGFIKELQVKEGQEVAEGDPLLTVVTSQITANLRGRTRKLQGWSNDDVSFASTGSSSTRTGSDRRRCSRRSTATE